MKTKKPPTIEKRLHLKSCFSRLQLNINSPEQCASYLKVDLESLRNDWKNTFIKSAQNNKELSEWINQIVKAVDELHENALKNNCSEEKLWSLESKIYAILSNAIQSTLPYYMGNYFIFYPALEDKNYPTDVAKYSQRYTSDIKAQNKKITEYAIGKISSLAWPTETLKLEGANILKGLIFSFFGVLSTLGAVGCSIFAGVSATTGFIPGVVAGAVGAATLTTAACVFFKKAKENFSPTGAVSDKDKFLTECKKMTDLSPLQPSAKPKSYEKKRQIEESEEDEENKDTFKSLVEGVLNVFTGGWGGFK